MPGRTILSHTPTTRAMLRWSSKPRSFTLTYRDQLIHFPIKCDGSTLLIDNEDTVFLKKLTEGQLTTYTKYFYNFDYSEETVDFNKY
jgi:hypothetical protein